MEMVGRCCAALVVACCVSALVVTGLGEPAGAEQRKPGSPVVYQITLSGSIDPLVSRMVSRGLHQARDAAAAAVLVRLDTPGGLDSSMRSIIQAIQASPVPVVCWVGPPGSRAASAGAFILIGCPVAVMAPGTNVGAAHPVGISGGTVGDKITNDSVAYIRSLAQARGRNADWAEQAVRASVSIPADEALRIGVIDTVASDRQQVFNWVDGRSVPTSVGAAVVHLAEPSIRAVHLTWGERLLHALFDPTLVFLLFVLGIAGVVSMVVHPGLRPAGVLGLVALASALITFGAMPVNVGGVALIVAAFVFFAIDLKVTAHGIPTLAGAVCLVFGGLYLFDSTQPGLRVSRPLVFGLAAGIAVFFGVVARAVLRTRRSPVASGTSRLIGASGTVTETLAPTGRVLVRGESWRATLESDEKGPLPDGAAVRVVAVAGLTLSVRSANAPQEFEARAAPTKRR